MNNVKTNSLKAWYLASRPKTLTGAIVPVSIALTLAWHDLSSLTHTISVHADAPTSADDGFKWTPAVLCLLYACLMQIDANLINDYFDFKRGIDAEDRLGPERACSQGWITMHAMKKALVFVTILATSVGLPLSLWGGWEMILVGLACVVFCYLYTILLSGKALGDVLVILFFGLVPVCCTYYIQTGKLTTDCILLAFGSGLATDNLLLVNNFRDRETDKKHGKITLVTLIGERATLLLYLCCVFGAQACATIAYRPIDPIWMHIVAAIYVPLALYSWYKMCSIRKGRSLNKVLGLTALSILVYGIAVCIGIIF